MLTRCVFFLVLMGQAFAQENFVRLYFIPSTPAKIDWDSPRSLLTSTIAASIRNSDHPIGHVNVEVSCNGESFLAGSTNLKDSDANDFLLKKKVGLSLLGIAWKGRLETKEEILASLKLRGGKKGQLTALTYAISPEACTRLQTYHRETLDSPYPRYYGFAARPRYHEGAGCSAFAVSFLEVAGIPTGRLQLDWMQKVKVPLSLMTILGRRDEISIYQIYSHSDAGSWVRDPRVAHMNLALYDPDLMHAWALRVLGSRALQAQFGATIDNSLARKYPKIAALKINAEDYPVPTEDIFLGTPGLEEAAAGAYVRNDLVFSANGSFDLTPYSGK